MICEKELPVIQSGQPSVASRIPASLWFALSYPFVLTVFYFVFMNGQETSSQNTMFSVLKGIQFSFPAIFTFLICRESIELPIWKKPAIKVGLIFGSVILVAALLMYFFIIKGSAPYFHLKSKVFGKVQGFGLNSIWAYAAFATFYSLIHSAMEEYYWRWFVYKRLTRTISDSLAIIISSLGFMAHHVVIMVVFFGLTSPLAYSFSLGVAVGGGVWAWLYGRSGNFVAVWGSHAIVDMALFIIGYDLIFNDL